MTITDTGERVSESTTPPPAKGATPPPPGTTPPPTSDEDAGQGSKRQVLADLAEERKERQRLAAELDDLKKKHMTDEEKAVKEAEERGRSTAEATFLDRLVRSEVRSAAAGKLADPDDAPALLGDLSRFATKGGEVDLKAITSAIDDLLKAKPYLGAAGARAGSLPGGGRKPAATVSINDDIRAKAGRG